MKIGDKVIVRSGPTLNGSGRANIQLGTIGTITQIKTDDVTSRQWATLDSTGPMTGIWMTELELITNEGVYGMLKTVGSDFKTFLTDNKSVIYTIAVLFLMDQLLFQGAFRERLHSLMNKFLGKVESQIDGDKPVALVTDKKA